MITPAWSLNIQRGRNRQHAGSRTWRCTYGARCETSCFVKFCISEGDWTIFLKHADATLKAFNVPQAEYDEVVAFVQGTKTDIVDA